MPSSVSFSAPCISNAHLCEGRDNIDACVKAIFHKKKFTQSTSQIPSDDSFGLILDKTSFYSESGGQEYDTGNITIDGKAEFKVENVQIFNGYVLHLGHLNYGQLDVGDNVVSSYDEVNAFPSALTLFSNLPSFEDGQFETTTLQHTF